MKRSDLIASLRIVAGQAWSNGEKRFDALMGCSGTSLPELCKIMAVQIVIHGMDCGFQSFDTKQPINIIREALRAYNNEGWLEFDPE